MSRDKEHSGVTGRWFSAKSGTSLGLEIDTIAAIATPPGKGGVGIVRLSGPKAEKILRSLCGKTIPPRTASLSKFRDVQGRVLDTGLALFFPGPNSFTGENVVELQGHGGPVVMDLLLAACLAVGARMANPGEFSERAFLNNKLDLVQAEAISDLINSASENAARAAVKSLSGDFSKRISELADKIIRLRIYVEASIDFPEEEIDFLSEGQVSLKAGNILEELEELLASSKQGVLLKEGIRVVIAGRPNVGKSSLLNRLLGYDRAIVTALAGTTRDALAEQVTLRGLPVTFVDTAGLRQTQDIVELEGINRTRAELERADWVLLVRDISATHPDLDTELAELGFPPRYLNDPVDVKSSAPGQNMLIVANKLDLIDKKARSADNIEETEHKDINSVNVSALTGQGLDRLVDTLIKMVGYQEQESGFIARRRHLESLYAVKSALEEGLTQLNTLAAGELFAEDLRRAHQHCGDILGHMTPDELLGEIFSSFCIGK